MDFEIRNAIISCFIKNTFELQNSAKMGPGKSLCRQRNCWIKYESNEIDVVNQHYHQRYLVNVINFRHNNC